MLGMKIKNYNKKSISYLLITFHLIIVSTLSTSVINAAESNANSTKLNQISSINLTQEEENWLSKHNEIRIALKHHWKPIEYMSEGQQFRGVFADYLDMLELKLGVSFVRVDIDDSITPTTADMLSSVSDISSLYKTDYEALNSLFKFNYAIYTHKKNNVIHDINDLEGKHVAVYKHGHLAKYLSKNFPRLNLRKVDITEEAFNAIKLENVDAYIGNAMVVDYEAKLQGISFIKKVGDAPSNALITMAVRRDWPILKSILNKSIVAFEPEKNKIIMKWDMSSHEDINYLIYILPIVTMVLGVVLFKSYKLKKTIQQKELEAQNLIWNQANFDLLTGLPNRLMFNKKLAEEIKHSNNYNSPFALLFIDLDYFKQVNDQFGHATGDELLIIVADRISNVVRSTDNIARLSGDEFTLILSNITDRDVIQSTADEILKSLEKPFEIFGKTIQITSSIGATIYPKDTRDKAALIKNADQAMYAAKKLGKNRLQFFTKSMQEESIHHLEISNGLQKAVISNEFKLHYQPIVDLATNKVVKAEALIRWHHPTKGILEPSEFINIAEESDVIHSLGHWVFEQSLEDIRTIQESVHPEFQVSINVSPKQFNSSSEINKWPNMLKKSGIAPNSLIVEITERTVLEPSKTTNKLIQKMLQAKMKISIDDFGTGYSSISYLKDFDISSLKLDRSFVRDLDANKNNQILCHSIIDMAHKLGIKVIAEGIENKKQIELLQEYGCDYGQGHFFSKADPLNSLIKGIQKEALLQ
jgi:diguanylate cyclase (GGDEF)-like protein